MIENLSKHDFKGVLHGNLIASIPIIAKDVENTYTIFGKTTRKSPHCVQTDYASMLEEIFQNNNFVNFAVDI